MNYSEIKQALAIRVGHILTLGEKMLESEPPVRSFWRVIEVSAARGAFKCKEYRAGPSASHCTVDLDAGIMRMRYGEFPLLLLEVR